MVKWAFQIYGFTAILMPWIFLTGRLLGYYNFPKMNTWIFIGLFIYSGFVIYVIWSNERYDKKTN